MKIIVLALIIILLNIPFGYWRANVRKYSLQWVLAVHLPVPVIIFLRIYSDIGFALWTYPVLVGAFFAGQYLGKIILTNMKTKTDENVSSCLVMDCFRLCK
jgi:hypothetical protein